MTTTFTKGAIVRIRPEFRDKGEADVPYVCIEDEHNGAVGITKVDGGNLPLPPWSRVRTHMLTLDQTEQEPRSTLADRVAKSPHASTIIYDMLTLLVARPSPGDDEHGQEWEARVNRLFTKIRAIPAP